MKGSIIPHLPRRHFGSYGQLPMSFSFSPLNHDPGPSFSPGSMTYVVPLGTGAVMVQEPTPAPSTRWNIFQEMLWRIEFRMLHMFQIILIVNYWD